MIYKVFHSAVCYFYVAVNNHHYHLKILHRFSKFNQKSTSKNSLNKIPKIMESSASIS